MKIYSCCQRQHCNPVNVLFNIMFFALICRRFLRQGPLYTHCCRALTLANSISYAFLLNLTEKSHKLSRIRVQTRRKATTVVADRRRVNSLWVSDHRRYGPSGGRARRVDCERESQWCQLPRVSGWFWDSYYVQQWRNWVLAIKVARTHANHTVHACSAHCPVGVLTGGAKLSL